jgi:hypothetical protein
MPGKGRRQTQHNVDNEQFALFERQPRGNLPQRDVQKYQDQHGKDNVEEERKQCRMGRIIDTFHLYDPVGIKRDQDNAYQYCFPRYALL